MALISSGFLFTGLRVPDRLTEPIDTPLRPTVIALAHNALLYCERL